MKEEFSKKNVFADIFFDDLTDYKFNKQNTLIIEIYEKPEPKIYSGTSSYVWWHQESF